MNSADKTIDVNTLVALRHDIKNQLTSIALILNQLRYEMPDASQDCLDYLEMIQDSARKIESLLNEAE
ncbi:MAG: hypothetical protein ACXVAY_10090 [Mucilaginibacter sp.]